MKKLNKIKTRVHEFTCLSKDFRTSILSLLNLIMQAKALVTGAAGFIGSHVCDHLVKAGYDVVALDDLSGGFEDNVNSKVRFIKGSINDVKL
ncbi:MAG TPA: NAD-dependent epimerase/dehydratase family protein, partial [Chitinophagaceae bacterium]